MARKKRNLILPIDDRGVPEKLRWIIDLVHEGFLKEVKYGDGREADWVVRASILHYLIKKEWSKKHKMPSASKNDKKYNNCLGDIYHKAYKLCVKSFEGGFEYSEEYNHPLIRWAHILSELSLSEGGRKEREILFNRPDLTKKMYIESLQNENRKLKEFKNPFCPFSEPHTWGLIEVARTFAEQTMGEDVFYKDFWLPLLRARGAKYIREINSPACLIPHKDINGDRVISLPGTRGQSKMLFFQFYYQNFKKMSPAEYLHSLGYRA